MSGQKQPIRFRLPWLPSLAAAYVPPARSSSSWRNRKPVPSPSPPSPPADSSGVIPIQIGSPDQPMAHAPLTSEYQQLPHADITTPQIDQQPLTQEATLHLRTDSQTPSKRLEAASSNAPTEPSIPSSETDSIPLEISSTSFAPVQQLSPTAKSNPLSPSPGSKSNQTKSQSSSPSLKFSPTRARSQPKSPPHTGTPTRANPHSPPLSRLVNTKLSSPTNAGNHTPTIKQPSSPSLAVAHTKTTALLPSPSRAIKHSKSPSKPPSPSPPSFQSSPSSSTGESTDLSNQQQASSAENSPHAQNSKHGSKEIEHKQSLPQIESIQPDAIQADESHTLTAVYDKIEPEPSKDLEVTTTQLRKEHHISTEEASDTGEAEQDKSHWSAPNKGKRKLITRRVPARSKAHHYNEGEGTSMPLRKEIKDIISDFIEKLSSGKLGQSKSKNPVIIITISGDNKGAVLNLGATSSKNDDAKPDVAERYSDGTKRENAVTEHEHQTKQAYINSNIQSINNSMLLGSSVHEMNPGVHFGTSGNDGSFAEPNMKEASSEAKYTTQVNAAKDVKQAHQPILRRRCLRGLFMEPSDSDAGDPDKPRRHGCRYASGDKGKYDF